MIIYVLFCVTVIGFGAQNFSVDASHCASPAVLEFLGERSCEDLHPLEEDSVAAIVSGCVFANLGIKVSRCFREGNIGYGYCLRDVDSKVYESYMNIRGYWDQICSAAIAWKAYQETEDAVQTGRNLKKEREMRGSSEVSDVLKNAVEILERNMDVMGRLKAVKSTVHDVEEVRKNMKRMREWVQNEKKEGELLRKQDEDVIDALRRFRDTMEELVEKDDFDKKAYDEKILLISDITLGVSTFIGVSSWVRWLLLAIAGIAVTAMEYSQREVSIIVACVLRATMTGVALAAVFQEQRTRITITMDRMYANDEQDKISETDEHHFNNESEVSEMSDEFSLDEDSDDSWEEVNSF